MHDTLAFLKDLVSIDSVNPTLVPGAAGEGAIAERLAAELAAVGLDVTLQEVVPGRPNVIGVLDGRASGPTLLFCGHIDTVGVEGMEAPFDPVERDGRVYGRGSQDMKGGVAAMVGAAAALAGTLARGRVVVAGVVDEEHASLGAEALVEEWKADGAVVTEPTDLDVATGHKGFAWVRIETKGRAAHGSRPDDGRDAVRDMGRVLGQLDRLDETLQSRPAHPRLGTGSLHAGTIRGGRELSVYPDSCVLELERRTLVGEEGAALGEVEEILRGLAREDARFQAAARLILERPPYEIAGDHPLSSALCAVVGARGRTAEPTGMSFWTDAAILGRAGIPTVLFGPIGRGLHGAEEFVEVESVFFCRDALVALAQAVCAGS